MSQSPDLFTTFQDAVLNIGKTSRAKGGPNIVLLSGAQGSGKSTLCKKLEAAIGQSVITLSLDDFYLTKQQRRVLADRISPLFETRGPPGTHDIAWLLETLDALSFASPDKPVLIPAFDKVADDRAPKEDWRRVTSAPTTIILEGWLLGAKADDTSPISRPINTIEEQDTSGAWRAYQEEQLRGDYATLWAKHPLFYLIPPRFDTVFKWRLQQEEQNLAAAGISFGLKDEARIQTFIQHYERITRRIIAGNHQSGIRFILSETRALKSIE